MVLGPLFVKGGIPQISHMHVQIAHTSEHVAGFGVVTFSRLRGHWRKNKILEKLAITAMYCHLRLPDAIAFPT